MGNSENVMLEPCLEYIEVGQGVSGGTLPLPGACTQGLGHASQQRQ